MHFTSHYCTPPSNIGCQTNQQTPFPFPFALSNKLINGVWVLVFGCWKIKTLIWMNMFGVNIWVAIRVRKACADVAKGHKWEKINAILQQIRFISPTNMLSYDPHTNSFAFLNFFHNWNETMLSLALETSKSTPNEFFFFFTWWWSGQPQVCHMTQHIFKS